MTDSDTDSEINTSDSESENEVIEEKTIDNEFPEDEIDEDTRMLLYCQSLESDNTSNSYDEVNCDKINKKKVRNNNNQIKNKSLTLAEYHQKVEDEKPKKWGSSIMRKIKQKKGINERNIKNNKIKFNPRLPPYKKQNNKSNLNNKENNKLGFNENFPEL